MEGGGSGGRRRGGSSEEKGEEKTVDQDELDMNDGILPEESIQEIPYAALQIQRVVGEGAYGIVMKGKYFGAKVAIKLLQQDGDTDEVNLYNAREVFNLQGMRHPNIVNMLGVTKHKNKVYIIMEWMSQGNLYKYLQNPRNKLSWRRRVHMARDAGHAIAYLHYKGLIHRDIKSENLVIGDGGKLKLADFGCSRALPKDFREESMSSKQKRLTITGTRDWMAPEVLKAFYDEKVDVFGYGVVLYELITRQMPPERMPDDPFDFDDPDIASQIPADCPPKLLLLAKACCYPKAEERPDFQQIISALKDIMTELPKDIKQATPDSAPPGGNAALEKQLEKKKNKLQRRKLQCRSLKQKLDETEEKLFDAASAGGGGGGGGDESMEEEFAKHTKALQERLDKALADKEGLEKKVGELEEAVFDLKSSGGGGDSGEWEAKLKEEAEQRVLAERQLQEHQERLKESQQTVAGLQRQLDETLGAKQEQLDALQKRLAALEEEKRQQEEVTRMALAQSSERHAQELAAEKRKREESEAAALAEHQNAVRQKEAEFRELKLRADSAQAKNEQLEETVKELTRKVAKAEEEKMMKQQKGEEKGEEEELKRRLAEKHKKAIEAEQKRAADLVAANLKAIGEKDAELRELRLRVASLMKQQKAKGAEDVGRRLSLRGSEEADGGAGEVVRTVEGSPLDRRSMRLTAELAEEQERAAELQAKVAVLEKKQAQRRSKLLTLSERLKAKEEDNARLSGAVSQLLDFTKKELAVAKVKPRWTVIGWLQMGVLVLIALGLCYYVGHWIISGPRNPYGRRLF